MHDDLTINPKVGADSSLEPSRLSKLKKEILSKYPIRHFNSRHRRWIIDLSERVIYDKNDVIFESGAANHHIIYLILGSISLKAEDGKYKLIHHSDEAALYPLAKLNPRQYTATAMRTNTVILWVPKTLIKKCLGEQLMKKIKSDKSLGYDVEIIPDRRNKVRE